MRKTGTDKEIFQFLETVLCDTDEQVMLDEAIRFTAEEYGCSPCEVVMSVFAEMLKREGLL